MYWSALCTVKHPCTLSLAPLQVAIFSDVLADLGDSQSLEQSLSTFSGHMQQVTGILRAAGPRSLVLLDELGSGTDPTEGARALVIGISRSWGGPLRAPPGVWSTHFQAPCSWPPGRITS